MAQTPSHMAFTCLNPECQQKIRINIPAKSGVYSITCPHCGTVKRLKLKGLDVLGQPQTQVQAPDNSQNPPISINQDFFVGESYEVICPHCSKAKIHIRSEKAGQGIIKCPHCKGKSLLKIKDKSGVNPVNVNNDSKGNTNTTDNATKQPVDLGDDFYVKQSYTVTCPHCNDNQITLLQENPGTGLAMCSKCKGRVQFTVRKPTETIIKSELIQRFRGKLILLRRGWVNKDYKLKDGKNIVGRLDEYKVSDIAIKGDSSMSRQSIEIFVDHHDKGYSFKLTVRNAVNPVLHNNKTLAVGDSISLNFGDSIILGKTKFRFDKDV